MKTYFSRKFLIVIFTALSITSLRAAPVTNWHTFKAAPATTLSGQGTSSPVLGSTNPSLTSSAAFLVGYFSPMALTNMGDRITLAYTVTFTDAVGIANAQDNFRFALFDLNGQTVLATENVATAGIDGQTDDWRGYWFGVRHPSGVGSIRERMGPVAAGGDNPFSATGANLANAPSLGAVGGDGVNFVSSTDSAGGAVYSGVMALEKSPSGVTLAGSFGGNGATNLFAANDNAAPFPANFAAASFLNGGPLSCDQMNFQNVSVTYMASNALQITSQPTNVTLNAGQSAQFSVSVSGSGLVPSYQWRENGSDITGATNATYTVIGANPTQDNFNYSVVISNVFGDSITSSNATLHVLTDPDPPTVLSASSLVSNVVNVIFSELVDPVTAQDGSSYSLSGNSISAITLVSGTNVALTLDNLITATNYVLTVQNVKDISGNPIVTTNVSGIAHGFQDAKQLGITNGVAFAFNDKPVVHAGGSDIFGTSDQFEYAFKTISGDFDIAVRIESLLNTSADAKAGLMARANTSELVFPDSRNVMIEATPARFIFQYRTNELQQTFSPSAPRPPTAFPNCWVRLKRTGTVFTGYSSTNNVDWTAVGSFDTSVGTEPYPAEILVGLAVTSHNVNQPTRAVFSGFGAFVEAPGLAISRSAGNIELTWPASAIGFNLQAAPALSASTVWTNMPASNTTNRVVISTSAGAMFFRLKN